MSKRKTTDIWVLEAKEVHSNQYDYTKVNYTGATEKIKIICRLHGEFYQTPDSHLSGTGCPTCGKERSSTLQSKVAREKFREQATVTHSGKYTYERVVYINSGTEVTITCPIHGDFSQKPGVHLRGCGCPKCAKNSPTNTERVVEAFESSHGNRYDYSLVDYKNAKTKVKIVCKIHGVFEQTPDDHKAGHNCPICAKHSVPTTIQTIQKFQTTHGSLYDYSKIIYTKAKDKVEIICSIHGSFWQTPDNHLNGQGCPKCGFSRGETRIEARLKVLNVFYTTEFRFRECKSKKPLPFDFAVFYDAEKTKLKCLIEFDGIQHYRTVKRYKTSKDDLLETRRRDQIKTDYCAQNNIKLIRIPYWDFENIEEILKKELKFA